MFRHKSEKESNGSVKYAAIASLTYGHISFAAFLIAAISGIFLAIPFDISNPFDSLSFILLTNPAGVLFRNIHYWSAQFFLVFAILHIYDHLKKSSEKKVKTGVWYRLTISLVVIFFIMLSGFIIKGDADGNQAKRIVTSLLNYIPFFGKELSNSFFGSPDSYQIIYVHHIASATIFLWIIIVEHIKFIWPKLKAILYLLPVVILLGYLFPPNLHDIFDSLIKGPWYFLGLQEILHWLSYPAVIILLIFVLLILLAFLPRFSHRWSVITKKMIFLSFIGYCILTIVGYFFRGEDWKLVLPWKNPSLTELQFEPFDNIKTVSGKEIESRNIPIVLGRREGCMFCHQNTQGFSPAHNPEVIGCVSCHGGNPFTLEKTYAHQGMILIPGNLDVAEKTCGNSSCHSEVVDRVHKTLMTTLSGIVSVDRYAFNESKDLNKLNFISGIGHSNADSHLRNLCASCHLGGKKSELGPINQLSRGGGCNACHLNYNDSSLISLKDYQANPSNASNISKNFKHPSLSLKITDEHCFGCHSRSGRISTNYEGWHDTLLKPEDVKDKSDYRILDDGRVFKKTRDDIHHEKGMNCIDCHTSLEVMGDGNYYLHEEQQVKINCTDCHLVGKPETKNLDQIDQESLLIASLRNLNVTGRKFLTVKNSGYPLINTYINKEGKPELITKNSGKILPLKPPEFVCTEGKGHKDLSCESCHTSWSPQCIGCHTEYESQKKGYDLLDNKETKGDWVENASDYLAEPPTLGIREVQDKNGKVRNIVDTFIPGMIVTLEKKNINPQSAESKNIIFRRLFAPTFSHTITKESRSCESCHNNPLAIGYGRGELKYVKEGKQGKWIFTAKYPKLKYDSLPEDAWIGFLQEPNKNLATRTNVRPFSIEEQKAILTVGACLTCHKPDSKPLKLYLDSGRMPNVSSQCILPRWN
jgi:hypothetical protein